MTGGEDPDPGGAAPHGEHGETGDPVPMPVVLVGGLHEEARRTAVRRLLRAVPGSVAFHHDLSSASRGTVRSTVRAHDVLLDVREVPLADDCACCALRSDLVPGLRRLAADGLVVGGESRPCALAVVELWDSVEPRAMAETVAAEGGPALRLAGVVTAVDPVLVLPYLGCGEDLVDAGLAAAPTDLRTVGDTFARQLEYAPVLALAEADGGAGEGPDGGAGGAADGEAGAGSATGGPARGAGAAPGAADLTGALDAWGAGDLPDAADHALLAQLHPTARRVRADAPEFARVVLGTGFDVGEAAARQHPGCALLPQAADEAGVSTYVWRRERPFHPGRLYDALEELTCAAVRSRGRFWLADRPDTLLSWDAAGGALCVEGAGPWLAALPDAAWELVPPVRRAAAALDWHPDNGDRGQHLVFVSPGLDAAELRAVLDACLLTDEEYAGGPEAWRRFPAAFDELLDSVR